MNQLAVPITRKVQSKDKITKSVYVTLSSDETGLNVGDTVEIEVISKGYIMIKKMKSVDFPKEESYIGKILEKLGIHDHVTYKLKDSDISKEMTLS